MTKFDFMDLFFRGNNWATNLLPYEVISTDLSKNVDVNIAVAGYPTKNLTVDHSDGVITVTGKPISHDKSVYVYHAGLARRGFTFKIPVASSFSVNNVTHKDGVLTISLKKNDNTGNPLKINKL